MNEIFAGIDFGGTNIKAGCFDSKLNLVCKASIQTKVEMGPEIVTDRIVDIYRQLLDENDISEKQVLAVGIGAPGPSDVNNGIILAAPNMPLFKNVPLRNMLKKRLSKPIIFENDANAACWAEYELGAGQMADDMVFLTLGTGIGSGIISNGKLIHGWKNNAGELGHIIIYPDGRLCGCGQKGCAEAHASAASTAKRAVEAVLAGRQSSLRKIFKQNGKITCKNVFEQADSSDKLAMEIIENTAMTLGILCVNILHTVGPKRIVFAGGMIAAGQALLEQIKYFFNQHIWQLKEESTQICFATLGEQAGLIGAAALARKAVRESKI